MSVEGIHIWSAVLSGLEALNLDVSPPTLLKYFILLCAVTALLWVMGDVYRGELQNRDMSVEIVAYDRAGYGLPDVFFTKRTFDTRAERLPARIVVEHRFLIVHGDRQISKRVRVVRRAFKLHAQPRQTQSLRDGQLGFAEEIEKEIKNIAEYRMRRSLRRYRDAPQNWLSRWLSKHWIEPEAIGATYVARVHFPSNPLFLLFQHPDREVKATGWLTLLTSAFALLAQFLFSTPNLPSAPTRTGTANTVQTTHANPAANQ
jgi:hypothetical protein